MSYVSMLYIFTSESENSFHLQQVSSIPHENSTLLWLLILFLFISTPLESQITICEQPILNNFSD